MPDQNLLLDRLAYVVRDWEHSHAMWSDQFVNGRLIEEKRKEECQCQHCKDSRLVLGVYDGARGEGPADEPDATD